MNGTFYGNVATFRPSMIPGLVCWYDGNDPSANGTQPTNGSSFSSLVDKSKSGNTTTLQNTAPTYARAFQNGKGVLAFNGSNQGLSSTTINLPQSSSARTIYFVCNNTNFNGDLFVYGTSTATEIYGFYTNLTGSVGQLTLEIGGPGNLTTGNTVLTVGDWYILETNYAAGGNVGQTVMRVNGVLETNTASTAVPATGNTFFYLGTDTGFYLDGYIAEVLIYNQAVSTANDVWIRQYLGAKWGISTI